jgi:hypothetical protein
MVVRLLVAVEVNRPDEVRARLVIVHLLFHQQRIRAEIHELLARDDALHDLRHFLVQQRFAAGDGHHRRAAFIYGFETVLHRDPLVQDGIRIVDLAAAVAGQIAAKQRLEHERERITLGTREMLARDVGANPDFLQHRNRQLRVLLNLREWRRR